MGDGSGADPGCRDRVVIWVVLGIALVLIALVALVVALRRRRSDGVADFQRHIGALSSEARRPVVDQVHQLDESDEEEQPPPERDA